MNIVQMTVFCGAAAIASSASAGLVGVPEGLNLQVNWGGNTWNVADNPEAITDVVTDQDGDMTVVGQWMVAGEFQAEWTIEISNEPGTRGGQRGANFAFISNSFSVTNLTGVDQDFMIMVSQAEAPIGPPTSITGSNSGDVSDGDGVGGATLSSIPGMPFYEALMDGVGVRTLFDAPQSIVAPQFLTNSYGPSSFVNEANANGVTASVGIINRFRLSSGDDAGMVSTFAVVPTPGTISLLAVAGIAGVRRRR